MSRNKGKLVCLSLENKIPFLLEVIAGVWLLTRQMTRISNYLVISHLICLCLLYEHLDPSSIEELVNCSVWIGWVRELHKPLFYRFIPEVHFIRAIWACKMSVNVPNLACRDGKELCHDCIPVVEQLSWKHDGEQFEYHVDFKITENDCGPKRCECVHKGILDGHLAIISCKSRSVIVSWASDLHVV